MAPAMQSREGCHFRSYERELEPGPGQRQQGEENRPDVNMSTQVEWTDCGDSCSSFTREKGKEKERQRQKEGSQRRGRGFQLA